MNDDIKIYIKNTIVELIKNTSNEKAIKKSIKKHNEKIHFIPIRYRIFNELLQSMNIKFGNFIERLLHIIIENEDNLEVLECSGKNNIKLPITQESDNLVDNYITECQNGCFSDMELKANFEKLLNKCITVEKNTKNKEIEIKHDIDVLFKNKLDNKIYYLEVSYQRINPLACPYNSPNISRAEDIRLADRSALYYFNNKPFLTVPTLLSFVP